VHAARTSVTRLPTALALVRIRSFHHAAQQGRGVEDRASAFLLGRGGSSISSIPPLGSGTTWRMLPDHATGCPVCRSAVMRDPAFASRLLRVVPRTRLLWSCDVLATNGQAHCRTADDQPAPAVSVETQPSPGCARSNMARRVHLEVTPRTTRSLRDLQRSVPAVRRNVGIGGRRRLPHCHSGSAPTIVLACVMPPLLRSLRSNSRLQHTSRTIIKHRAERQLYTRVATAGSTRRRAPAPGVSIQMVGREHSH